LIFLPPLARTTKRERRDKVGNPLALTGDDVLKENEEETMVAISTLSHKTPCMKLFCSLVGLFIQATRD
jgi:hypothetical protein